MLAAHNIPPQPTSFIGRQSERNEIAATLDNPACRLLTLVGPGGIGKTRLALQVAEDRINRYPDGVCFVDLTPVQSPEMVAQAIGVALGLQMGSDESQLEQGQFNAQDQLLFYLYDRNLLLVLDNFEHLIPAAEFVDKMLHNAPDIQIVVTSRVALNIEWEWPFDVRGMAVPKDDSVSDFADYSAIQLFAARAQRAQRHFDLISERANVTRITQMLEGMPLGLELAASWLRVMSCTELASELVQNPSLLSSRQKPASDRHHSLRAVFEQSWRLLTHAEQNIMMKLSVFKGAFSRKAAEVIAGASIAELSGLVDHSLVRLQTNGRYDLHELVRQFCTEKLAEYPDATIDTVEKHCDYYCGLLATQLDDLKGARTREAMELVEAASANIRAAWLLAIKQRKTALVANTLESWFMINWIKSWADDGPEVSGQAVEQWQNATDEDERILYSRLLSVHGAFLSEAGHKDEALDAAQQAVLILSTLSDPIALAFSLLMLGRILLNQKRDDELVLHVEQGLNIYRQQNDAYWEATALRYLGRTAINRHQLTHARQYFETGLEIGKAIGNHLVMVWSMIDLGRLYTINIRDVKAAKSYFEAALAIAQTGGIQWGTADALRNLGDLSRNMGEYDLARQYLEESFHISRNLGVAWLQASLTDALGWLEYKVGNNERARQYFDEVLELRRRMRNRRDEAWALASLGATWDGIGDHEKARQYREDGLRLLQEVGGDERSVGIMLGNMSFSAIQRGDFQEAQRRAQQAIDQLTEHGYAADVGVQQGHLGFAAAMLGKNIASRRSYRQALSTLWEAGITPTLLENVAGIARHVAAMGEIERAVELAALAMYDSRTPADSRTAVAQPLLAELQAELPPDMFETAVERGKSLDLETVVEELLKHPVLAEVVENETPSPNDSLPDPLTERELEVLQLVAQGLSNRQIAKALYLALGTVKTHIHNIYSKLDVENRTQATNRARELNLV